MGGGLLTGDNVINKNNVNVFVHVHGLRVKLSRGRSHTIHLYSSINDSALEMRIVSH